MTCTECGCTLIPQRTWQKLNPLERDTNLKAGIRQIRGRGLCNNCYMRHYSYGEFPRRTTGVRHTHSCTRCGITSSTEFCRDCAEVTA